MNIKIIPYDTPPDYVVYVDERPRYIGNGKFALYYAEVRRQGGDHEKAMSVIRTVKAVGEIEDVDG